MTDFQFNAAEVLEKRLASSLGLDRYAKIMQKAKTTDISKEIFSTYLIHFTVCAEMRIGGKYTTPCLSR